MGDGAVLENARPVPCLPFWGGCCPEDEKSEDILKPNVSVIQIKVSRSIPRLIFSDTVTGL